MLPLLFGYSNRLFRRSCIRIFQFRWLSFIIFRDNRWSFCIWLSTGIVGLGHSLVWGRDLDIISCIQRQLLCYSLVIVTIWPFNEVILSGGVVRNWLIMILDHGRICDYWLIIIDFICSVNQVQVYSIFSQLDLLSLIRWGLICQCMIHYRSACSVWGVRNIFNGIICLTRLISLLNDFRIIWSIYGWNLDWIIIAAAELFVLNIFILNSISSDVCFSRGCDCLRHSVIQDLIKDAIINNNI